MNKKSIITMMLALVATAGQGQTIPHDWFKTDTITIRGRIEGFDAERFGFTAMECYFYDAMEKDNSTLLLEINSDGTFEKRFPINYPRQLTFSFYGESKVGFSKIPLFARPGETKQREFGISIHR